MHFHGKIPAHEVGEEGTFILMAMEIDFDKKNVVIATGEAPFDQYNGLFMPEIHNYERYAVEYPQQGARLFENIIGWVAYYSGMMMDIHMYVVGLLDQVTDLEGEVATLKSEVTSLEGQVTTLEGEKTTAEDRVKTLEDQLTGLQTSITTWQYTVVVAFLVGLIIGVAVIYVRRRS